MRLRLLLFAAFLLSGLVSLPLLSQTIAEYQFAVGTGTPTDMSTGTTTIIANAVDDGSSGIQNIGFTFRFANVDYTQFSVSSNGAMRLGSATVATTFSNSLTTTLPMIASFFDDHHTGVYDANGYAKMRVTGSAPNRVLTIEWRVRSYASSLGTDAEIYKWQARLYETTNVIDFLYIQMRSDRATTATIGIANSATANNYISVTPGSPATISRTAINNSANIGTVTTALAFGTRFVFSPCNPNIRVSGNIAQGGTANMAAGDTLLSAMSVMRGSATGYTPLNIDLPTPACAARNYTYSISGANAGDYSISPTNGSLSDGQTVTPTVTFRPTGTGNRPATLTVTDNNGFSRSFVLLGKGLTRIKWSGNLGEGGTAGVVSGDTLINGLKVTYGFSKSFTPLIVENINLDPQGNPPANVTYTLDDPTGHYSISPASTSLNGGQNHSVQITFNAQGDVGFQEATLTVNADGEVRTYLLRAFNAAPGGEFYTNGVRISRTEPLFTGEVICVGQEIVSLEVQAVNTGAGNFVVRGAGIYRNDTLVGQGIPPYPLVRDGGQPVGSIDYFLSNTPGVLPKSANAKFDSLVIPEKETRTFYMNFIATRPGKRYATFYFNTNAFNTSDPDVNGVPTRGVLQAGAFGHGKGSYLTGAATTERPAQVALPTTDVRVERRITTWISNSGKCDLRIAKSDFRLQSGDVNDFSLVEVLPNTAVSGSDFVLPPGARDSIVVSFTPNTYGSRRATIRLVTNDSTLGTGAVEERGVYYWDVYGVGRIGLEARGVTLPPAVIGGPSSKGFVLLENASGGVAEIESITLTGGTNEIIEDVVKRWPSRPALLKPGEKLQLWVELKPGAGSTPGPRTAEIIIRLKGGAEARAQIQGYVGTRLLSAQPGTLFNNVQVRVGDLARQYVAVTNIGTLPIHLNNPVLVQTNPGDYRVNPLIRRVLEPGQTELLEVTYTPQGAGVSSGTLTFSSDGTNGSQVVNLGGEGTTGTKPVGGDPAVTGSSKVSGQGGLQIMQMSPNPARDHVELRYGIAEEGTVTVLIYDGAGHMVKELSQGVQGSGTHNAELNLSGLSSGTYHCVVKQGERTVSQVIQVVK